MFSSLRASNQIYILHKEATPYVETGIVTAVTAPMPSLPPLGAYGQPTMFSVDVTVRVNEQLQTFQKLPANADVADWGGNGNIVVATTRDAINGEIKALSQRSADVIASEPYHRNIIDVCAKIYQQLNPEEAEKAAQAQEINTLKSQMGELMQMNQKLLEQLQGLKAERTSSKKD